MQHLIGEEKERTLVRAVLSLFLLVTKRLYGKEWEWSIGQIKTCRKKQHVEIDDRKEMPDLFCGKAAVGGNYNLMRDNITSVITGDGKIHTFQGLDMGIEDEGIFTFECFGGEDGVIYGTHVEVDLSDNPTLADFVRKNTGKEFEVVYVLEGTMTQPVEQVVPIGIKLY